METQVSKVTQSQTEEFRKIIESILTELNKIKDGNNDAVKQFVYAVKLLKEKTVNSNRSETEKNAIIKYCGTILNNILVYLNSNDKLFLDMIEKHIKIIKDYVDGVIDHKPVGNELVDEETRIQAEKIISNRQHSYDFSKIDKLYIKLYRFLRDNNKKEIINIRGRIIRKLKKNNKTIEEAFSNIQTLYLIEEILNSDFGIDEKKSVIEKLLSKEENSDYREYFDNSINNLQLFMKKFEYICKRMKYARIVHYMKDYSAQLKNRGRDLKKQYETEFLDQILSLKSFSKIITNGTVTAIKILANTVGEFKATDSKRKKMSKLKETFVDIGRIASLPFVISGKVFKENWLTIYTLLNGYISKIKNPQQDDVTPEKENTDKNKVLIKKKHKQTRDNAPSNEFMPVAYDDGTAVSNPEVTPNTNNSSVREGALTSEITPVAYDDGTAVSNPEVTPNTNNSLVREGALTSEITPVAYDDGTAVSNPEVTPNTNNVSVREGALTSEITPVAYDDGTAVSNPEVTPNTNNSSVREGALTSEITPVAYDDGTLGEKVDREEELNKGYESGGAYIPELGRRPGGAITHIETSTLEDGCTLREITYDTNTRVEIISYPNGRLEGDPNEYHGGIKSYREYDPDGSLSYDINFYYGQNGEYYADVVDADGNLITYKRSGPYGRYTNTNAPNEGVIWDSQLGRMVNSQNYVEPKYDFAYRYDTILTTQALVSVDDYVDEQGATGTSLKYSDGTVVNVSTNEKVIVYPNGDLYRESNIREELTVTYTDGNKQNTPKQKDWVAVSYCPRWFIDGLLGITHAQ